MNYQPLDIFGADAKFGEVSADGVRAETSTASRNSEDFRRAMLNLP